VSDPQAAEDGYTQILQPIGDGLRRRPLPRQAGRVVELADRDAGDALERAAATQLG